MAAKASRDLPVTRNVCPSRTVRIAESGIRTRPLFKVSRARSNFFCRAWARARLT
jgi:hypothetical protein